MDEQKRQKNINPLMIQSYFDGELKSEEMEAVSHEDLVHSEMFEALDELRSVVRTESRLALEDIDGYSLLDAINKQIDSEMTSAVKPEISPLSQPKRRTSRQVFQRWAPALVGAALFLLSIPGLVHWIAADAAGNVQPAQPAQTVVVIDSNGSQHPQNMVNYQNSAVHPVAGPADINSQLTVEEMDFAIRHLIKRIETLENHQNGIENGAQKLLNVPALDGKQL